MNKTKLKVLRTAAAKPEGEGAGFATRREVDAALALAKEGLLEVTCDRYLSAPHIGVRLTEAGRARAKELAPTHVDLGDIVVTSIYTRRAHGDNPYASGISGTARGAALSDLFEGKPPNGYEYWHAPASGGARRINPKGLPLLTTTTRTGATAFIGSYRKERT